MLDARRWWVAGLAIATVSCGPEATATIHTPAGDARVLLDTPFEIQTEWARTCDDSSLFDRNSSGVSHLTRCASQDYRVEIECSSSCDVRAGNAIDGTGSVMVTPRVRGPLSLTAVMTRQGDHKTVQQVLDTVEVVFPSQLGLLCTDGLVNSDCGVYPVPLSQAVVRPVVRLGASEVAAPHTMMINDQPLASVISTLGTVSLAALFPAARRADGSVAPGRYVMTLSFHDLHGTWDVRVE